MISYKKSIAAYTITKNGFNDGVLKHTIESLNKFADYIIIVVSKDSDGGTIQRLKDLKEERKIDRIITEDKDFPQEEAEIREMGFEAAQEFDPDWIFGIDDDEVIVNPEKERSRVLGVQNARYIGASLHHLWEGSKKRVDDTWNPKKINRKIGIRNKRQYDYSFYKKSDIHCGRTPDLKNLLNEPVCTGAVDILHFGWRTSEEERQRKMSEKAEMDSYEDKPISYEFIQKKHYNSLEEEPELEQIPQEWVEKYSKII